MLGLVPSRGLSNSQVATRKENRFLGASAGDPEGVTEEEFVRNFIEHCGAEQKARHSTPFFVWVKSKKVYNPDLEQRRGTIHRSCG